ncbi:hypothetical protein [Chitinophaga sp.]|uniref:hypothetical protein n=1 Tax=Chitinophaga sp. TaxID=1869181 RepID=UPI002F94F225
MSNSMIVESKGITIDPYFIPAFDLRSGEIAVLSLLSGAYFQEIKTRLINILTGKVLNEALTISQPLTYVPHFRESWIRRNFYPSTVGRYLKKNAQPDHALAGKIYEHALINKRTRMKTLHESHRQLINLYATLSNTKHIVFDLIGQGPESADIYYRVVKEMVKQGGAAILLDNFRGINDDCTTYIEMELLRP